MRVYFNRLDKKTLDCIILVGLGLVGKAIHNELASSDKLHYSSPIATKLKWSDIEESKKILAEMLITNSDNFKLCNRVTIIWAAGKIGFRGNENEAEEELEYFKNVVDYFEKKFSELRKKTYYVLISSLGGIFEGKSIFVKPYIPEPKRPYGFLKLSQEKYLLSNIENPCIVRLSSVFSNDNFSSRQGLISTLFMNGLHNNVTTISGNSATLRDYILDKDIAVGIRRIIGDSLYAKKIHFFASGHSVSIFQLKIMVEKILRKKLYINYLYTPTNNLNMAYSADLISESIKPSDLNVNLTILRNNILRRKVR